MTVGELIEGLQKCDPSLVVVLPGTGSHEGAEVVLRRLVLRYRLRWPDGAYSDPDGSDQYDDTPLVRVVSLLG